MNAPYATSRKRVKCRTKEEKYNLICKMLMQKLRHGINAHTKLATGNQTIKIKHTYSGHQ